MLKTRLLLPLLFLLFFSQLLFAANLDLIGNSEFILGGVIMLMIIVLTLTYQAAHAFNMPALEAWVKTELREMIIAAILLALIGGLFIATNPVATMLSSGASGDYKATILGLTAAMQTKLTGAYYHVLKASHYLTLDAGFSTSFSQPLYFFGVTQSGAPLSGYSAFLIALSNASSALTNSLFIYAAIAMLIDFFITISPKLLPIAFAFRFIPFTRQMGSTLIALLIGAYILFPFSIVLVDQFHSLMGGLPSPKIPSYAYEEMSIRMQAGELFDFLCSTWYTRALFGAFGEWGLILPVCIPIAIVTFGAGWEPCVQIISNIVYPILVGLVMLYSNAVILAAQFSAGGDIDIIFDAVFDFLQAVTQLALVAYIDAIIIGTVTFVGVRSVATALSGEYFLGGISRLV